LTLVTNNCEGTPMNKAQKAPHPPTRWFAGWRTDAKPMQDDPADLGTAFGLEMSLNAHGVLVEQNSQPNANAAAAATDASPSRRAGLMQRLAGHRKPAA
jgi:hypothetical protein